MLRSRRWVAIFIAIQVLVPGWLLIDRAADEGWKPTTMHRYSWQMYSTANVEEDDQ